MLRLPKTREIVRNFMLPTSKRTLFSPIAKVNSSKMHPFSYSMTVTFEVTYNSGQFIILLYPRSPFNVIGEIYAVTDSNTLQFVQFLQSTFNPSTNFIMAEQQCQFFKIQQSTVSTTSAVVAGQVNLVCVPGTLSGLRTTAPTYSKCTYQGTASLNPSIPFSYIGGMLSVGAGYNMPSVDQPIVRVFDNAPDSGAGVMTNVPLDDSYAVQGDVQFPNVIGTTKTIPANSFFYIISDSFLVDIPCFATCIINGTVDFTFQVPTLTSSFTIEVYVNFTAFDESNYPESRLLVVLEEPTVANSNYIFTYPINYVLNPDPAVGLPYPHKTIWSMFYSFKFRTNEANPQNVLFVTAPRVTSSVVLPQGNNYNTNTVICAIGGAAIDSVITATAMQKTAFVPNVESGTFVNVESRPVNGKATDILQKLINGYEIYDISPFFDLSQIGSYETKILDAIKLASQEDEYEYEDWLLEFKDTTQSCANMVQAFSNSDPTKPGFEVVAEADVKSFFKKVGKLGKKGLNEFGQMAKPVVNQAVGHLKNLAVQNAADLVQQGLLSALTGDPMTIMPTASTGVASTGIAANGRNRNSVLLCADAATWKRTQLPQHPLAKQDKDKDQSEKLVDSTTASYNLPIDEVRFFPVINKSSQLVPQMACITKRRPATMPSFYKGVVAGLNHTNAGESQYYLLLVEEIDWKKDSVKVKPSSIPFDGTSYQYAQIQLLYPYMGPVAFTGTLSGDRLVSFGSICLNLKKEICNIFGLTLHTGLVYDETDPKQMRTPKMALQKMDNSFQNDLLLCADFQCATLTQPSAAFPALSVKKINGKLYPDHKMLVITREKLHFLTNKGTNIDGYIGDIDYQGCNLYIYQLLHQQGGNRYVTKLTKPVEGRSLLLAITKLLNNDLKNDTCYSGNIIDGVTQPLPMISFYIKQYLANSFGLNMETGPVQFESGAELLCLPDDFVLKILPIDSFYSADKLMLEYNLIDAVLYPVIYEENGDLSSKDGSAVSLCAIVPGIGQRGCLVRKKYLKYPFISVDVHELNTNSIKCSTIKNPVRGRSSELAIELFNRGLGHDGKVYSGSITDNKVDPLPNDICAVKLQFCADNGLTLVTNYADQIESPYLEKMIALPKRLTFSHNTNSVKHAMDKPSNKALLQSLEELSKNPKTKKKLGKILAVKQVPKQNPNSKPKSKPKLKPKTAPQAPVNKNRNKIQGNIPKPVVNPKQKQMQSTNQNTRKISKVDKPILDSVNPTTLVYRAELPIQTTAIRIAIISAIKKYLQWYETSKILLHSVATFMLDSNFIDYLAENKIPQPFTIPGINKITSSNDALILIKKHKNALVRYFLMLNSAMIVSLDTKDRNFINLLTRTPSVAQQQQQLVDLQNEPQDSNILYESPE
jgi:hypothetical protein